MAFANESVHGILPCPIQDVFPPHTQGSQDSQSSSSGSTLTGMKWFTGDERMIMYYHKQVWLVFMFIQTQLQRKLNTISNVLASLELINIYSINSFSRCRLISRARWFPPFFISQRTNVSIHNVFILIHFKWCSHIDYLFWITINKKMLNARHAELWKRYYYTKWSKLGTAISANRRAGITLPFHCSWSSRVKTGIYNKISRVSLLEKSPQLPRSCLKQIIRITAA